MNANEAALRQSLDQAASTAAGQIGRAGGQSAVRRGVGPALTLALVGPAVVLVVQLIRLMSGQVAGLGVTGWLFGLVLIIPLGYLAVRFLTHRPNVARRAALAAVDQQLATGDRLLTADEFLEYEQRSGFEQAAIEDAVDVAQKARAAHLEINPAAVHVRLIEKLAVPAAIVLLALGVWVSTLAVLSPVAPGESQVALGNDLGVEEVTRPEEDVTPPSVPPTVHEQRRDATRQERRTGARTTAPASKEIPEGAQEASGSLGSGQTSESEQSSSPSNARGAPSSQGQPSKPGDAPKKKATKPKKRAADKQQEERPHSESSDPAGSTAGQGSSRGSNKNPAVSDWSSRDQISTPDDDQVDEQDDVEDEEEEQESRGGVQPNLRDRRPPVNRDLRIGFGNQKNPDANGRGGPSAQKKSRGVASLVLGAPISDRVKGQPNPGKTKVTQQRIQPEFEPADATDAQSREPRDGQVGPVYRPQMSPWLRSIVRRFFLDQRPIATQPTDPS